MSDDDKKPEMPDDDGWGAAADEAEETPAENVDSTRYSEWADPVNLEEKVAALRAAEQQPQSGPIAESGAKELGEQSEMSPGEEQSVTTGPGDDIIANPATNADQWQQPAVPSVVVSETEQVERGESIPLVSDEDAPQWATVPSPIGPADEQPISAPSSDMLAAAGVIASKTSDPRARKRKEPRERSTGSGLTRKQTIRLIAGAVVLVIAGVGAILGWLNSQNYYLVCGTKSIRAEQGRFWPTGQNALSGPAFRAIAVPSDVVCESTSFESREELELAFLDALLAQSTRLLTSGGSEQVTVAEAQLEQALLLTREPERAEQRELAERLQGDVSYWRGAADVQRAVEVLELGATSFEEAAAKRPRHSSDASAWAEHARFIAEEIDKGPRSLRANEAPKEKPHFSGLTDPKAQLKPQTDASGVPEAPPIDAGVPTAPPADADVPPIDAALPRGGVLL